MNIPNQQPSVREAGLQKIIQNQQLIIHGLQTKVRKYEDDGLPNINRLEQELSDRKKQITNLSLQIRELQSNNSQGKAAFNQVNEKSRIELENMRGFIQNEKKKFDIEMNQIRESHRLRELALKNENKLITEELMRLKNYHLKENDRDFSKYVTDNIRVLEDFKKLNAMYVQKEIDHKVAIQNLKKEQEANLDIFNQHLTKCSQEKRELNNKYLEDLTYLNPETEEYRKLQSEFTAQIKELKDKLNEKDLQIIDLTSQLNTVSEASEQVKDKYQELVKKDEEFHKIQLEAAVKRIVEENKVEIEKLHLTIKEREIEISGLRREIKTMKVEEELMEQNLEEIKKIAAAKEWSSLNEIQALKLNNLALVAAEEAHQKSLAEQLELYRAEIKNLQLVLLERSTLSQGLDQIKDEVESVQQRLENICRNQKEFFEREKSLRTESPERQKSVKKLTEGRSSPEFQTRPSVNGERKSSNNKKSNLAAEHRALAFKNSELEKRRDNEIAQHKMDLDELRAFWDRCLECIAPLYRAVEELHGGVKNTSKKVDHLQKVVLPEKKIIDSVHSQVDILMNLVDEYHNIKEELCLKLVHELEIQKYENKILSLDQELELTRNDLANYVQSTEALRNMINGPVHPNNHGDPEIISLRFEIKRLEEQNAMLHENSRKLEDIYEGQINNITRLLKTKNDFDLKLDAKIEDLVGTLNDTKEALIDEGSERTSLTQEVIRLKEQLRYGENMCRELKSIILNSSQKVKAKHLESRLQELANEETFLLRNQLEILEQKNFKIQKNVSEERIFLQRKAHELELFENNPLRLYEELYEATLEERNLTKVITDRIDKMNSIEEDLLKEIKKAFPILGGVSETEGGSPHKSSGNLLQDNPETMKGLKNELHILREEMSKQQDVFTQEKKFLDESFNRAYDLLQSKLEATEAQAKELGQNNIALQEFNLKARKLYQANLEKVSEEYRKKFEAHIELMNSIVLEARKAKEEVSFYKKELKETEEEVHLRYLETLQRLENLVDQIEISFKERKTMAIADLNRKRKIEEEVVKENLNFYELLQSHAQSLKKQIEEDEAARVQEKSVFVDFIDNFKQTLEQLKIRIVQDKKKYEDETGFYKRLLEEKDKEHEDQIKTLKNRFENKSPTLA